MSILDTGNLSNIPPQEGSTNRGLDTKVTSHDSPETTVTLEKINNIVMGYLSDTINPTVDDNGTIRKVPVQYGDEERWKTIRADGFMRDPNTSKILTPLLMLRRTEIGKGPLYNPNNKYVHTTLTTGWNSRNAYDKFAVLNNIIPSEHIRNVIIPDYMDISYEGIIWTEYQAQMDKVIETINVENDEFWGERNNFKFRVSINSYQSQNRLPVGQDRVVRTEFRMKVSAYLIPDRMLKNMKVAATSQEVFTAKKLVTFVEFTNSVENIKL